MKIKIAVHGGVGGKNEFIDGVEKAADVGYSLLKKGKKSLDAVVEAVAVMEDDERFNAGTGSRYQLDEKIRMDACVMDSRKNCGAVIGITNVKNPIKVAREIIKIPHIILCGEGAVRFARARGYEYYDKTSEYSKKRLSWAKKCIRENKYPKWAMHWKKNANLLEKLECDTVGAVAMDRYGNFAAASSTGGISFMLPGRVGDTAIIGAGLYAGVRGAVTATGVGEEVIRCVLSKYVYDKIGKGVQKAVEEGINIYPQHLPIGLIAISKRGIGIASTHNMPCVYIQNNKKYFGPKFVRGYHED